MSEAFDPSPGRDNVRYLPSVRIPLHELTDCALCGTTPADCAALTSGPLAMACCTTCNHTGNADHHTDHSTADVDTDAEQDLGAAPGTGVALRTPTVPQWVAPAGRSTGRWVKRNAGYALAGSKVRRAERRARRKHTDLTQAIATLRVNARGAEDFHTLKELEDALERRRAGSSQRARETRIEVLKWTGGTIVVLASGHVILLGYGAFQSVTGTGSLTDLWHGIGDFWTTLAAWSPAGDFWWAWALAGAGTWAVRCIPVGRDRGELPTWAADAEPTQADGRDIIPDESAVLSALRHLGGLPELRKAFKDGWGRSIIPTWVQVPHRDGKGWRMQLVLPKGVPVAEIVKRKNVLAHNLVRLPVEVWPSEPKGQPGVLDLWVADQGALSGPVDPWPLLHEGTADYFVGVPLGFDIRGQVVWGRLFETNYAVAGMMGSGKSTLIISLLLGAMLDPLVDIDVFVLAENSDYDPMQPRLRTLATGAKQETVKACLDTLSALYADLEVRGQALKQHGERAVTRKLAEKDARLRPRIVVVDECQALFMDPDHGEAAADAVALLISAARKYAVTLVFATPEPSTTSLPRKVMAVISCKACFAIGDQISNDAIMGTGSHKSGVTAVSLEPKTAEGPGDIGTAMVRGIMPKPGLLRSCYVRKGDGVDEVTPVVERAMGLRAGHVPTPTSDNPSAEVDVLADLAHVMGTDKHVRTAVVLSRLVEHNPGHYGDWTFKTLSPSLAAVTVPIRKSNGDSVVRADDIAHAITIRDEYADDATNGDV